MWAPVGTEVTRFGFRANYRGRRGLGLVPAVRSLSSFQNHSGSQNQSSRHGSAATVLQQFRTLIIRQLDLRSNSHGHPLCYTSLDDQQTPHTQFRAFNP